WPPYRRAPGRLEALSSEGQQPLLAFAVGSPSHCPLKCVEGTKRLFMVNTVFWNMKTITKAFKLIDVNKTGLVQPQELKRLLETFCLKMTDEEYKRFSKHYDIDKDTAVDYNVFLKNLGINNDLNLRYFMGNQEITRENQQAKLSRREHLPSFMASDSIWDNCPLDDIERTFCREVRSTCPASWLPTASGTTAPWMTLKGRFAER
uniref:EF-hand domain-containing protein n=1 Tax=Spermophilus dauricus TaxID=99837 RepID=A0A8C9Q521_SPEDA